MDRSRDFGMALSYDRLLMSALLVLFVQSFANDSDSRRGSDYDYFTAAFLLNILFLVKISGLVLGLAIVVAGLIIRRRFLRSLGGISLVLLFLAVMVAIDFMITGTSLQPVIQDYMLAFQARTGSKSVLDALWIALQLPIFGVVVLMALYAISRPRRVGGENLRRCFLIIALYWVCQVVLNMSNGTVSTSLIILAPAAAVAVVTWTDIQQSGLFWDRLWSRFHLRKLHEISAREIIPLLILALVIVPEVLGLLRAIKLYYSISSGTFRTIALTANKGFTFEVLSEDPSVSDYVPYLNQAIQAIEDLGAGRETIANLDFMNPFPVLFLAPAPKGVSVWWDFTHNGNVPAGYRPTWQEIIGNACIVTEPKQPHLSPAEYSQPLIDAVKPHLAIAFTLVFENELWKIWKYSTGCGAMHQSRALLD